LPRAAYREDVTLQYLLNSSSYQDMHFVVFKFFPELFFLHHQTDVFPGKLVVPHTHKLAWCSRPFLPPLDEVIKRQRWHDLSTTPCRPRGSWDRRQNFSVSSYCINKEFFHLSWQCLSMKQFLLCALKV